MAKSKVKKSDDKKILFLKFSLLVILLTAMFILIFSLTNVDSIEIFISYPILLSIPILFFLLFVSIKIIEGRKDKNKVLRPHWKTGFFGLFALFAIPPILRGEWIWATWLVWVVWFVAFIPIDKKSLKNKK